MLNVFREISNKRKDRLRNANIRLDTGVKEIEIDLQKRQLRWFRHVMRKREERIP